MNIDLSPFPKFGNMSGGGGLNAVFSAASDTGYAESTIGWAGVDMRADPQSVDQVELTCAENGWDASGSSGLAIKMRLYGKLGAIPSGPFDGVLLGQAGPIRDINKVITQAIYSTDFYTKWDFLWVVVETPIWSVLRNFQIFPPEVPIIGSQRTILRRRSDSSQPISRHGSLIPGLRFLFELTEPAAVVPLIKVEIEHIAWATGVGHVLSCGCYLLHRTGSDLADLVTKNYQQLDVSGRNLNVETHYERHEPRDAAMLQPGTHELIPQLNSNTYQSTGDMFTTVLVEHGRGLNKGIIDVDPNAQVLNL